MPDADRDNPTTDALALLDRAELEPSHTTQLGRLYAMDCLDVLRAMPEGCVDLVVTSPPYERQPKYGNGEKYERDWFEGAFMDITGELLRVLKPTGQFVLNFRSRRQGAERSTLQYELVFWLRKQGWLFAEDHVWVKPSPPPGRYKQALKDQVEYCFRFAKSDAYELYPEQCLMPARWDAKDRERRRKLAHNFTRVNAPSGQGRKRVQAGPDWVAPGNALVTEPEFSPNPTKHPARFPPSIPEYFIKLCTRPGQVVLDPFAGTCTAAVVAEALERRWIMAELDEKYCAVLPDRLEDLRQRMAKAPKPVPGTVPEGVRTVPLPFALPAPKLVALRRAADEVSNGVHVEQVGERRGGEDAAVGVADHGPESVVEATPPEPIEHGEDGDTTEALGFGA
ncbi:MAG: site-specific DNA-methyltransferase [Thermoleophilaceae bacterium]|nr:site-specific DNA-methyltransferase [Thermoleophilaceae bacterium]